MTVGTTQLAPGNGHNYIINGAFDIWQRGASFSDPDPFEYGADRWSVGRSSNAPNIDFTQSTDVPDNFVYSIKAQRTSGDTSTRQIQINTNLETAGIELAGKEVTLSFYAKAGADFSGDFIPQIITTSVAPSAINYSSGGGFASANADRDVILGTTQAITTSWARYKQTGTVASTANGMQVRMRIDPTGTAGADDSIYITGVQLEVGPTATPFKRNANSIAGELAACQRYYFRYKTASTNREGFAVGHTDTSTLSYFQIKHPVTMRAAPDSIEFSGLTVGRLGVDEFDVTDVIINRGGFDTSVLRTTITGSQPSNGVFMFLQGNSGTSSFLGLEAEL